MPFFICLSGSPDGATRNPGPDCRLGETSPRSGSSPGPGWNAIAAQWQSHDFPGDTVQQAAPSEQHQDSGAQLEQLFWEHTVCSTYPLPSWKALTQPFGSHHGAAQEQGRRRRASPRMAKVPFTPPSPLWLPTPKPAPGWLPELVGGQIPVLLAEGQQQGLTEPWSRLSSTSP